MKQVAMSKLPMCDLCNVAPAMYDSPTVLGKWAYQCEACNAAWGIPGTQLVSRLTVDADTLEVPMYDPAIVAFANDMGLYPEDVMNLLEDSGQSIEDLGY